MRKTKSAILESGHETVKGLPAAGVMEQVTLRKFERLCLPLNLCCRWSLIDTERTHGEKSTALDRYQ